MSKQTYIDDLKKNIGVIDRKLTDARKKFEQAELSEKVEALNEVAWLKIRHKHLLDRLEEAKKKHADEWSEVHKYFTKDIDALLDEVERLIVKYS